jgi:protein ImuA
MPCVIDLSAAVLGAAPPGAAVWRADQALPSHQDMASLPTGFATLDAELPGGGWPAAGLTELLAAAVGGIEWLLLAPALAQANQAQVPETPRPILCVTPPHDPYAPALQRLGVDPARLLKVCATQASDAAWAAEQGLKAQACAGVVWWVSANITPSALSITMRRLQLAAQQGQTPLFVVRPWAAQAQASPALLRLSVAPAAPGELAVKAFKRRGLPMALPALLKVQTLSTSSLKRWQALASLPTTKPQTMGPKHPNARQSAAQAARTQGLQHAVVRPAPAPLAA